MQQAHFAPTATRNELCDACIGRKGNNWYSLVGRFAESEQLNVTVKRYSTEQYFCREKVPISNEWRNDLNSLIESTPSWRRTRLGRTRPTAPSGAGPKPCGLCSDGEAWAVWANPSCQGLRGAGEERCVRKSSSGSSQPGGLFPSRRSLPPPAQNEPHPTQSSQASH